ncbi:MAG: META domain-containing protein [Flavobacteriaceae bacterium]|nr:META domain-containing protein [Flavobacteriaceae bacterium]
MKYFYILMVAVMFQSCISTSEKVTVESLAGSYTVTTLNDKTSFPQNPTFEINAEELKISGFSGCNRFFGSFTFSENSLKFGKLGATQMMCPEEQNATERMMMKALEQTTSFNFEDNVLRLLHDGEILVEAERKNQ